MTQNLTDTPPRLENYLEDYLNDPQIREQLFRVGREGFITKGRGVVVVDLRRVSADTVRFYYLSAGSDEGWADGEMEQVCQNYDAEHEVIIFLFFDEFSPRNECYKLALDGL